MLSNVIDIDEEAMTVSLRYAEGAIILFDFKAAFPSMSQEYLLRVLLHLEVPDEMLNLVLALYNNGRCKLSSAGVQTEGFALEAGIRQGCPLSPLLFAVTVDLLLRKLERLIPEAMRRAFADDMAMVTRAFWDNLPTLQATFREFGQISGLQLNLPKTWIIPLWHGDLGAITQRIARDAPDWSQVQVVTKGRYLGFMTGPGKGDLSWDEASVKYEGRVTVWAHQQLGLHGAALTYNVFALSVLTFLAQLENPPEKVMDAELKMLRSAAPGPGVWCLPADLWYMRELYGQTRSFGSIAQIAKAAQVRVATWEAYRSGGLNIRRRSATWNGRVIHRRALWRRLLAMPLSLGHGR
jgi:hypothetical protein